MYWRENQLSTDPTSLHTSEEACGGGAPTMEHGNAIVSIAGSTHPHALGRADRETRCCADTPSLRDPLDLVQECP